MRAPWDRAASRSAGRSAIRPSADWAALTATSAVPGRTASASDSSGTARTLRSPRTWKGFSTEVKSSSAVRTSAPGGRDAATSEEYRATVAPAATRSTGTPASRAYAARHASTSANSGSSGRPAARSRAAASSAATVRAGSRALLAVFR